MRTGGLVAFCGRMGAGKTCAAEYLIRESFARRVAFADHLKDLARRVTPDGQVDKVRDRKLLQLLGDYHRGIDPAYFLKAYRKAINPWLMAGYRIVTDDLRFPNEVETIKKLGGYIVFISAHEKDRNARLVERDGAVAVGVAGHATEDVGMLRSLCDDTIVNDGSLEAFYQEIDRVTARLKKAA